MKRTFLVCVVALVAHASPSAAADRLATDLGPAVAVAAPIAAAVAAVAAPIVVAPVIALNEVVAKRGSILLSMYAACGLLQAYDGYSTIKAVASNHVELNPLMAPLVKQPGLVVAAKAAMTIATIAAAENLWRNHHRKQAIVMLVVSNGLMAAVGAHNAMVLRGQR